MVLEDLILKGQELYEAHDALDAHRDYNSWVRNVAKWFSSQFEESGLSAEWAGLGHSSMVIGNQCHDYPEAWEAFHKIVNLRLKWLGFALEKQRTSTIKKQEKEQDINVSDTKDVFIVHGRDVSVKETVARFVQKIGCNPVILHEQPNSGQTIIEKFEHNSNVGYSVVLLTGDDAGGLRDDATDSYQLRARQNVIFEMGYFVGKIGRKNVCAIYQEGVEIPSDYNGVVFVKFDAAGAWKLQLAKEMKESGLPIDLNSAI